jgi:hypothetical protein
MSYAIWVREQDAEREVELCRVEANPHALVQAMREKRLYIHMAGGKKKLSSIKQYVSVRFQEI